MAIENKNGQLFTGYPFDKSQSFASEERRMLRAILGRTYGVIRDLPDSAFKATPKTLSVDVEGGSAIINGGLVTLRELTNVKVDANSTGTIVIQLDLSQDNSSYGTPEDGSYEYMLNQVNVKAIKDEPQYDISTDSALRYDIPLYKYTVTTGAPTLTDVRRFAFLDFPVKRTDLGVVKGAWAGQDLAGNVAGANISTLQTILFDDRAAANGLTVRRSTKAANVLVIENHTHREFDMPITIEAQMGAKSGSQDRNNKYNIAGYSKTVDIGADENADQIIAAPTTNNPMLMQHISGTGVSRNHMRFPSSVYVAPNKQVMFAMRVSHSVSLNASYPMTLAWANIVIEILATAKLQPIN